MKICISAFIMVLFIYLNCLHLKIENISWYCYCCKIQHNWMFLNLLPFVCVFFKIIFQLNYLPNSYIHKISAISLYTYWNMGTALRYSIDFIFFIQIRFSPLKIFLFFFLILNRLMQNILANCHNSRRRHHKHDNTANWCWQHEIYGNKKYLYEKKSFIFYFIFVIYYCIIFIRFTCWH